MTSEMPIKIRGKTFIAKIGGYTGRTESDNPIDDIYNGYMIWLNLAQSRKVPRIGKIIKLKIGNKEFRGKIIGGPSSGRYGKYRVRLKKILLETRVGNKLDKKTIRKLHEIAVKKAKI
ncbi:hypothetical protein DRJ25_02540 [Candidatus Woesearchaeota archaeon]|nr:MAG: hypothetical protein DRJ25_02540 [Candidatus Woesearchaeota archaeon]